jgi:hypothetical protein
MAGTSDNDGTAVPAAADPERVEAAEAIRTIHARIDELHRLVVQRAEAEGMQAGHLLHTGAAVARQHAVLPAWCRPTKGEIRWPVAVMTAAGIALQVAVPSKLVLVHPSWILPAVQGALLVALVSANPHRIDRQSTALRSLSLVLAAVLSLANGWSVVELAIHITRGTLGLDPAQLLATGAIIWLTNVVAFSLWYWEFDRGGPVARALHLGDRYPDFQYPQMVSPPEMVSPDWEPAFLDYLYLAFTNAAAFSPTDTMPMSRWAKAAMTVQSIVSIVTVALVVSRAVNILPSGT